MPGRTEFPQKALENNSNGHLRHTAGQENEEGDLGREAERQRVLDRVRAANITTEH